MPEFAGFVHTSAGAGSSGLTINLYARNDHSGSVAATTTTDSNGYYTISHGTEGRYDIEVVIDASNKYRVRYDDAFQIELGEFGQLFLRGTNDAFTTEFRSVPSAARIITIPDATDTMALLAATQTLASKTLTSPVLNTGVSGSAVLDEDDMASNSATKIATQQSIKAYVDAVATASDLDIQGDSGVLSIDLDSETLDIAGGTGVTTTGSGNEISVAVDAAQTGINSILATDLIIGEDAQTAIDFGTEDEIDFKAANAARLTLTAATLFPVTTNQISLGTASLEFKDAFFDGTVTSDAFAGPLTGDVTGNASGTAATVTSNTQASITTLTNVVTVGELVNGSIASGFGTINNGANTITTTGLVTAGSLTVSGTTTLNGALVLGDAAGDTLDITASATVSTDFKFADNVDIALGTNADILMRNRSTAAAANLEITDIILGTSVHPGVAANSLVVSNITADGDMMFATNRGGNTEAHMLFDASAGDTFLYARGVQAMKITGGGAIVVTPSITANGGVVGDLTGDVTGNADTATALAAGRTIAMTGDVTWTSASFTGAGNVTGAGTIADNAVTLAKMAGIARGKIIYGDASGNPAVLASGSANQVLTMTDGDDFDWADSTVGDITSIVAGTGLTGSSLTSGDATLNVIGGTGITANANDIAVDASQTQITAIGTIGTGVWQGTPIATAYIADNAITLDKLAGGTDGNIISFDASGNPVAIATGNDGQVLTSAGTGAPPAFEDAAAGGGITHASQWRTNATASGSTSYDPLVNFEAADTDGAGTIGTAMTYSSGVFTFPVAGVWQIDFTVGVYQGGTNTNYFACFIETDNGTGSFAEAARGRNNMGATGEATNTNLSFIFDVTDVSDHKVQFKITDLPTNAIVNASTSLNRTFANFIRLGDT